MSIQWEKKLNIKKYINNSCLSIKYRLNLLHVNLKHNFKSKANTVWAALCVYSQKQTTDSTCTCPAADPDALPGHGSPGAGRPRKPPASLHTPESVPGLLSRRPWALNSHHSQVQRSPTNSEGRAQWTVLWKQHEDLIKAKCGITAQDTQRCPWNCWQGQDFLSTCNITCLKQKL